MLLICTFNCSAVSGSDWLLHHNLTWKKIPHRRETYVHPRDLLLLYFLATMERMRLQIYQMEAVTETPGGHGSDPSDSLVNLTYVRFHMPTNISYSVNVKMLKICTFGKLKNMPVSVFGAML